MKPPAARQPGEAKQFVISRRALRLAITLDLPRRFKNYVAGDIAVGLDEISGLPM